LENCVDVPRRPSVARNRSKSNAGTLFLVSIRPESSTDRIRPWAPQSIIAELEEAIQCGSQDKRVETLRRVIDLFLSGADRLNDSQIAVFDDVLGLLIKRIESKAMTELSARLAPVDNAPPEVVRRLAWDDNIAIAEPVLAHSARLTSDDLIGVAEAKGQQHLLAIAGRSELAEAITDVLVDRGDRAVKHKLAGNTGARFSESGFSTLVKNAENDEALTERIGLRIDLPIRLLKDRLLKPKPCAPDCLPWHDLKPGSSFNRRSRKSPRKLTARSQRRATSD
jgi:uncharacterized protein (DUF2336 family)